MIGTYIIVDVDETGMHHYSGTQKHANRDAFFKHLRRRLSGRQHVAKLVYVFGELTGDLCGYSLREFIETGVIN
jgi:hypothetical protein